MLEALMYSTAIVPAIGVGWWLKGLVIKKPPSDSKHRTPNPSFIAQFRHRRLKLSEEERQATATLVTAFRRMATQLEERNDKLVQQYEQEQIRCEQRGVMLAKLSHELRTPIHSILSFAELGAGKKDVISDDNARHYFLRIQDGAQKLMVLVSNLLDMTRLESGVLEFRFEHSVIEDVIRECVEEQEPFIKAKHINMILSAKQKQHRAVFDALHIGRVINNLLSNAIKHTPDNGKISIQVTSEPVTLELKDGSSKEIKAVVVSVQDNGTGIAPNELESVFKPFSRGSNALAAANKSSSGLGLAICREVVQRHGGRIWAENGATGGAIFRFSLPAEDIFADLPSGIQKDNEDDILTPIRDDRK